MNRIKKHALNRWFIIGILTLSIAVLNVIRMIIGFFQTPKGYAYLAIGHYYQDNFEYAQQIAQGIFGHWLVQNQFTTHDPTRTLIGWGQYIFIGKFALLFGLSPFTAYWVSIFLFSIALLFLLFIVIRKMLPDKSFLLQISAFLFCIYAVPFVKLSTINGQWSIIPFDFWYAPLSLFHRIGRVPHHILTTIFILLSLLLLHTIITGLSSKKIQKLVVQTVILVITLILLLTFGPLQVVNLLTGLGITGIFFLWKFFVKEKNSVKGTRFFVFLAVLSICILPSALIIKESHQAGELFKSVMAWEMAQQSYPPLPLVLLTIGPILLFVPFGIRTYFRSMTPIKLLVFFLTLFSYLFASSTFAIRLGTFNLRFLTPLSYLFFGVSAVLGIEAVSNKLPRKKAVLSFFIIGFLLYSISVTFIILQSLGPVNPISYQPKKLLDGIKILTRQPDTKAVLTSPAMYLGMIVPCIVDRNVYLGRMFFTPNYEEKITVSDRFYQGMMTVEETRRFLSENNIGYVLLSATEPYPPKNILQYPFIREIFKNQSLTVFFFQE